MIRAIVAMDDHRGIAIGQRIPWHISTDQKRFQQITSGQNVIMGYHTYQTLSHPLRNRRNYVWCSQGAILREGFEPVYTLDGFLQNAPRDLWVIGGGELYTRALPQCDELYITRVTGDYNCTVFFPEFNHTFYLDNESQLMHDGEATFCYQLWKASTS